MELVQQFSPKVEIETFVTASNEIIGDEVLAAVAAIDRGEISLQTGLSFVERLELSKQRALYSGMKANIDRIKGLIDVTPDEPAADPLRDWLDG